MTSPSLSQKLRRNLYLTRYLAELSTLTGRIVQADELCSPAQAAAMRIEKQKFLSHPATSCEIGFSDKNSERFGIFLQRLRDANPSPVYIWTEHTIDCGALLVPSLDAIRFDFDFKINKNGVLTFETSDLEDKLLLDFFTTPEGKQVVEVETKGINWTQIAY